MHTKQTYVRAQNPIRLFSIVFRAFKIYGLKPMRFTNIRKKRWFQITKKKTKSQPIMFCLFSHFCFVWHLHIRGRWIDVWSQHQIDASPSDLVCSVIFAKAFKRFATCKEMCSDNYYNKEMIVRDLRVKLEIIQYAPKLHITEKYSIIIIISTCSITLTE